MPEGRVAAILPVRHSAVEGDRRPADSKLRMPVVPRPASRRRRRSGERRSGRLVRAASSLTVVSAERQGLECFTFPETHLPNALDLFAFVPYLVLKAAGSAFRSAQQALAAFVVAFSC